MGFAEEAVKRFYRNLINGLTVLLNEGTITENTTVKELLDFSRKKEKGE